MRVECGKPGESNGGMDVHSCGTYSVDGTLGGMEGSGVVRSQSLRGRKETLLRDEYDGRRRRGCPAMIVGWVDGGTREGRRDQCDRLLMKLQSCQVLLCRRRRSAPTLVHHFHHHLLRLYASPSPTSRPSQSPVARGHRRCCRRCFRSCRRSFNVRPSPPHC